MLDPSGAKQIETPQNSAICPAAGGDTVDVSSTVTLNTPFAKLPKTAIIMFEIKHFKASHITLNPKPAEILWVWFLGFAGPYHSPNVFIHMRPLFEILQFNLN